MAISNGPVRSRGNVPAGRARETFEQFREDASEYAEHGRDRVQRAGRALSHFVREQPLEAILIGASIAMVAGVGLVLCRMWMRRQAI
jgi:ElaB/YqjD/DUF883 family membrane-anchored ribosome-binding protein